MREDIAVGKVKRNTLWSDVVFKKIKIQGFIWGLWYNREEHSISLLRDWFPHDIWWQYGGELSQEILDGQGRT